MHMFACVHIFACVLDIDLKIPLTCHINCVGDMLERSWMLQQKKNKTGNRPVSSSKQDAGIPRWKCLINCVGGMLERGVSMCIASVKCVTTRICMGIQKIIWTRKDFDLSRRKWNWFAKDLYSQYCVYANLPIFHFLLLYPYVHFE